MNCAQNQRGQQTALLYHALLLNPLLMKSQTFGILSMTMGSHLDPNKHFKVSAMFHESTPGFFLIFFLSDPDRVGKLQQQVKGKAVQIQSEMDFYVCKEHTRKQPDDCA